MMIPGNKTNRTAITTLAVIACLLLPIQANAQENSFGIKGGLNLSTLTIEDADDNNIIPGFHAGIFAKYMVSDNVAIKPEVLYSTKGVKTVYDQEFLGFDIADGETRLNLGYIDIPVYVAYYLAEDFNFHIGPYAGILLNNQLETEAEILDFIQVDNAEEIDGAYFNTLDYGVSLGLGFSVDPVMMGFNYNLGLRQVVNEEEAMESLLGDAKNNVIQVYIGFTF